MLRKVSIAVVLLGLCVTFAAAETLKGTITKIDAKAVTVVVGTSAKSHDLDKACKFFHVDNGVKLPIKDGVKAAVFQKLPPTGLSATVTTNTLNHVTEITLTSSPKGLR
jgi:hypothetical protein